MQIITCPYCGSRWQSEKNTPQCPFCGKELAAFAAKTYTDMSELLCDVKDEYGIEVFKNAPKVKGLLKDKAPGLKKEIKLFSMSLDSSAFNDFYSHEGDGAYLAQLKKDKYLLMNETFISEENADTVLDWYCVLLGIQPIQKNNDEELKRKAEEERRRREEEERRRREEEERRRREEEERRRREEEERRRREEEERKRREEEERKRRAEEIKRAEEKTKSRFEFFFNVIFCVLLILGILTLIGIIHIPQPKSLYTVIGIAVLILVSVGDNQLKNWSEQRLFIIIVLIVFCITSAFALWYADKSGIINLTSNAGSIEVEQTVHGYSDVGIIDTPGKANWVYANLDEIADNEAGTDAEYFLFCDCSISDIRYDEKYDADVISLIVPGNNKYTKDVFISHDSALSDTAVSIKLSSQEADFLCTVGSWVFLDDGKQHNKVILADCWQET